MTADMRTLIRSEVERVLFAYDVLPEGDDTIIIAAVSLDDLAGELTRSIGRILERGIHEQLK